MPAASSHNPPRVMRPRPTDATGWGWAFISLVVGLFFAAVFPLFALVLVLVAFPFCFLWQFKKWHADSSIVKDATGWCRSYYPDAGGTPIVDFMIAVAHDTRPQFSKWSPDTGLDDLNWMSDDDQVGYWYPDALDRTQAWLCDVFLDAKISGIDVSVFSGTTLGNVIDELITPHKTG